MFTTRSEGATSSGRARNGSLALWNQSRALRRKSLRSRAPEARCGLLEPASAHAARARNGNGRAHAHRYRQPRRSRKRPAWERLNAHGRLRRREPTRHAERTARARRAPNAAHQKPEKMRRKSPAAASSSLRAGGAPRRIEGDHCARCAPSTIAGARLQKLPSIAPSRRTRRAKRQNQTRRGAPRKG